MAYPQAYITLNENIKRIFTLQNIAEKFNPGTKQMINAGKAYLKALHGAAAASRVYVDSITKLARQAQQATWSGCSDIGSALMQIVEVYKETQAQHMNILKAFYVDVLVPLETNLEKDTKVVQYEQKRFAQQHKQRIENYSKAEATVKKYRKKQNRKNASMDKELKSMQLLEDEKNKLDEFCERSMKNAIIQERRRYGFVLERQTSLAKHNEHFLENQRALIEKYLESWTEIAKARENIPESVEKMFSAKMTRANNIYPENGEDTDDEGTLKSPQLRKAISMDAAGADKIMMINGSAAGKHPLTKSKSDFNVSASTMSLRKSVSEERNATLQRPKSLAISSADMQQENCSLVRALFTYLANGENQMNFLTGDVISVIGNKQKGWQYGENLRTRSSGWFPLSYTEKVVDDECLMSSLPPNRRDSYAAKMSGGYHSDVNVPGDLSDMEQRNSKFLAVKPPTKFGDSIVKRGNGHQAQRGKNAFSLVPAPICPAPAAPQNGHHRTSPRENGTGKKATNGGNASLHSSNDSGFSNDPPPAPDVDYSDDDNGRHMVLKKTKDICKSTGGVNGSTSISEWLSKDDFGKGKSSVRQSNSLGQLMTLGRVTNVDKDSAGDKSGVKRTKSLWKFNRKSDDAAVFEGSLWKHRSLVDINGTQVMNGTPIMDKKMALRDIRLEGNYDSEEVDEEEEEEDDDDENLTLMNGSGGTLKRGGYGGEGSDQESCIVVQDHGRKAEGGSKASTMLPRTRLVKTSSMASVKIVGNGFGPAGNMEDEMMTFESAKLQTFKFNRVGQSDWFDSWGERRKKIK